MNLPAFSVRHARAPRSARRSQLFASSHRLNSVGDWAGDLPKSRRRAPSDTGAACAASGGSIREAPCFMSTANAITGASDYVVPVMGGAVPTAAGQLQASRMLQVLPQRPAQPQPQWPTSGAWSLNRPPHAQLQPVHTGVPHMKFTGYGGSAGGVAAPMASAPAPVPTSESFWKVDWNFWSIVGVFALVAFIILAVVQTRSVARLQTQLNRLAKQVMMQQFKSV